MLRFSKYKKGAQVPRQVKAAADNASLDYDVVGNATHWARAGESLFIVFPTSGGGALILGWNELEEGSATPDWMGYDEYPVYAPDMKDEDGLRVSYNDFFEKVGLPTRASLRGHIAGW